jgi:hypothetical protein
LQRGSVACWPVVRQRNDPAIETMPLLALHWVRSLVVRQRTGTINQIRGFLIERGITVQQRLVPLRKVLVDLRRGRRLPTHPAFTRGPRDRLTTRWCRHDGVEPGYAFS